MKLGQALWPPLALSILLHVGVLGLSKASRLSGSVREKAPAQGLTLAPIDVSLAGKSPKPTVRPAAHDSGIRSEDAAAAGAISGVTLSGSASASKAGAGELDGYASQVRERIGRSLQYPVHLQRRGIKGRVGLRLTLDAQGRVQSQEITEHSRGPGAKELDELALAAVREAEPFPEPPPGLSRSGTIVLNLPVDFKLGH